MTRSFSIRYFPMLVAVALSVGFILGALFPVTYKAEAATVSLTVRVHPGAIGYLTCGWHGSSSGCPNGAGGQALDWANNAEDIVLWRSNSRRSDAYYPAFVATAYQFLNTTPYCWAVDVQLWDAYGISQGYVRYTHTYSGTNHYFDVVGDTDYTLQAEYVGVSVSGDLGSCDFRGSHTHQTVGSGWTKTGPPYPNAPGTGWYNVWDYYSAMHLRNWTVVY